jgi:hypothetical protein
MLPSFGQLKAGLCRLNNNGVRRRFTDVAVHLPDPIENEISLEGICLRELATTLTPYSTVRFMIPPADRPSRLGLSHAFNLIRSMHDRGHSMNRRE